MSNNQNISINTVVCQGTGNIVSDMDGEKVMLSIRNGKYYNLGDSGSQIWEIINEPASVKEVVNTLISQYEVESSVCEEQVLYFLGLLAEKGLIDIKRETYS